MFSSAITVRELAETIYNQYGQEMRCAIGAEGDTTSPLVKFFVNGRSLDPTSPEILKPGSEVDILALLSGG